MYIKQGLIENMSTKIGDTIWILLMITIITIVGVCCVTIAKWGIIGYGVVSFISSCGDTLKVVIDTTNGQLVTIYEN